MTRRDTGLQQMRDDDEEESRRSATPRPTVARHELARWRRRTSALALVLAFFALAGAARAEAQCPEALTPDQAVSFAREVFERGEQSFIEGDFEMAVSAFRCSYDLVPHPNTYFNLAESLEEAGDLREALARYRDYLERYPSTDGYDDVVSRIERLEPLVAALPPEEPPPSEEPVQRAPSTEDEPPARERGRPLRIAGYVSLGLGLAVAVSGGVFMGLAVGRHGDFVSIQNDNIDDVSSYMTRLLDLREEGQMFENIGYALIGVGSALLVTSVVLLIVGRRRRAAVDPSSMSWLSGLRGDPVLVGMSTEGDAP